MDIIPPKSYQFKKPQEEEKKEPKEVPLQPLEKKAPELKTKKNKKSVIAISFFILAGIIFGGYFFLKHQITSSLDPLDKNEKIVEFEIGDSARIISKKLEEKEIIRGSFYFLLYVYIKDVRYSLQAGKYSFSPSMSIPEIAQKIIKGESLKEEVKVTIPEGFRISQIEARINKEFETKNNEIKIRDFKVKDFKEKFSFLQDAPDEERLEGYLFPDSYIFLNRQEMASEEKSKAIAEKMLENFRIKLNRELRAEIKKQEKSIFEIITMASILEKEVRTKKDREIVSGIFWKRIKGGKQLESCASIAYILGENKWRYSYEDTRIESPYNTYLNRGLPKGPISNPGIESIKAAIYSEETDYLFFLTDPKTGETIFSKTLEEHNQNKVKYLN